MKLIFLFLCLSHFSYADDPYGLSEEDQKYFKNEPFDGKNKLERIDANVREINKLHGEVESLKNEVKQIKEELSKLKKSYGAK